ncbi:MAG: PIN domain-containing protein [Acidimicrobiales bacterium]
MATDLADKSAPTPRDHRRGVREVMEPLVLAGRIASCGIVDLELLYNAPARAT